MDIKELEMSLGPAEPAKMLPVGFQDENGLFHGNGAGQADLLLLFLIYTCASLLQEILTPQAQIKLVCTSALTSALSPGESSSAGYCTTANSHKIRPKIEKTAAF
jgi:hypothetical protein